MASTEPRATKPLEGLRVVDVSQTLAGTLATQLLADFGADVVMVEPPGGSVLRTQPAWPAWGRGKKSVVLDLHDDADRDALRTLVAGADVFLETWRPGVAEERGLGYDDLTAANPGLVYASIAGFARTGPYSEIPVYDGVVLAKLGAFHQASAVSARPGPTFMSAPYCSFNAAQLALHGILASLYERATSGRGQRVATTLVQGLSSHDTWNWMIRRIAQQYPEAFAGAGHITEIGDRIVPNQPLAFRLLVALSADGRWMQFSQSTDKLYKAFLDAAGLSHLFDDPRITSEDVEERDAYWEEMLVAARARTYDEWYAVCDAHPDVWAEMYRHGSELLDHPQMVFDHQVVQLDDPVVGTVMQPGPMVQLSRTPGAADRPAPALDAHRDELGPATATTRTAGGTAAEPAPDHPPLEGVIVLELGTFFAGPYGATLLRDLGARVVKIEQLDGDPIRWIIPFPEIGGIKALLGKESIAVDINTDEGRAIVHDLVKQADLVLCSFRAGIAERAGLDPDTLLAINPDLVYLDAPGYGTDGPCGRRPAFAPTIGAGAGLAWRNVGPAIPEDADLAMPDLKNHSMRISGAVLNVGHADGFSSMGVGTALLLGLVARQRGAGGQRMLTTMLSTMAHALSEVMVRYDGQPDAPTADAGLHGFAAGYRLYEAADGEWVFLAAVTPRDWQNLVDAVAAYTDLPSDARFATPESRAQHDDALAETLATMFATRPAHDWEKELCAAGVACVVAERTPVDGNMYDEGALGRQWGYVTTVEHPVIGEHTRLTPLVQFSRSGSVVEAGCAVGQHTDAVLHEIGYDDDRIAALRDAGIVGGPGRAEPAPVS